MVKEDIFRLELTELLFPETKKKSVDFVTLSFYKMFGYPTGIGALIVKNDVSEYLVKRYFSGGTVAASLSQERFHQFRKEMHSRFEDGTANFLSVIAVNHGLQYIQNRLGGIENITKHTNCLRKYLICEMRSLKHFNNSPVVVIYGEQLEGIFCDETIKSCS